MNAPTDKDKALLRQALGQLAAETMPAPGWEQRALPRRPRRLLWLIPAAAAAIAAIIFWPTNGGTHPGASTPKTTIIIAEADAPRCVPTEEVETPHRNKPIPAPTQTPEITVILPEPEPTEMADYLDMPIGDYIDMMIEEQLLANAEIISTII